MQMIVIMNNATDMHECVGTNTPQSSPPLLSSLCRQDLHNLANAHGSNADLLVFQLHLLINSHVWIPIQIDEYNT